MPTTVNPILSVTALLRPLMPAVYKREQIYDPTYADPSYAAYTAQKIVPQIGSLVQDADETPLWVISVDPTTFIPTYSVVPVTTENDNVISMLDYGNSLLRLYIDRRALPYPITVDSKCVFLGKSPRFYTLSRLPGTPNESVISQYFDSTGTMVSYMVPLVALDSTNSSWYLPRCATSHMLVDNEEIRVKIFDEAGTEVYSALLFVKQSEVINEDVLYTNPIVSMTISGTQRLVNGDFYLYEKQDFASLGLTATIGYTDGTTVEVPVDDIKCIMYGHNDFISSFAGLRQSITVKYFRSINESISPSISDPTGEMISVTVPVTVVPNTLGITSKIVPLPTYNHSLARYIVRYYMYFSDGRHHVDVSAYVTVPPGAVDTTPTHFGQTQSYQISVDMHLVDPSRYPVTTTYTQNITVNFGPPTNLVKWWFSDSATSPFIYGQDNNSTRRPVMRYDSALNKYFIPSNIFANSAAFVNSFYTMASPPYDPQINQIPVQPDSFIVRDLTTGITLTAGVILNAVYDVAFNLIEDIAGTHNNSLVVVEFLHGADVLFGVPVDVTSGTYIGS